MKKLASLILLATLACQTIPPARSPQADLFDADWNDRSIFKSGLAESAQPILDQLPGASVYHLEYRIANDVHHVEGSEQVRYTNQEILPLDEVQFHLFPNVLGGKMTVSNVSVNGETVTTGLSLSDSLLHVPLAAPLPPGQSVIFYLDFSVEVPQNVDQNYGVLAFSDGVLALAHAYPMIAVYDAKGWEAEIPSPQGDVTYSDVSFYLVKITAPKGLVLVGSGRQIQRETTDTSQVVSYASGPARDFYLAASPNYKIVSATKNGLTINSYAAGSDRDGAQLALDIAFRAIGDYSRLYASYPYTQFNIVATPTQALGIEYPGMIALASRIYDPSKTQQGTSNRVYLEATVAHEVGHQWFYNLVGDNQLDEPWLDESFAQFATLEYYTTEYGSTAAAGFRNSLQARWDRVNDAKIPIDQPVSAFSGPSYGAIVYGRGPLFLEALQTQMGRDTFREFIQDYVAAYSWRIATTDEVKSQAEQDCSCNLVGIFNTWIYPN